MKMDRMNKMEMKMQTEKDGGSRARFEVRQNGINIDSRLKNMQNFTMKMSDYKKDWKDRKEMTIMTANMSKDGRLQSRIKFDKYFEYGMMTMGQKIGSDVKQCTKTSDCDGKTLYKMCCVSAVITNRGSGTQESMFRCMNYRLASMNFDMSMDNMKVSMKCTDSSAKYMTTALLGSIMSLVFMALY